MTLQTILEQNRERLMSAISGADTVSAIRMLNSELDRILYTFNDQEENTGVRVAANSMVQLAKASCSLVDSAGETKIYGRTEYSQAAPAKKREDGGAEAVRRTDRRRCNGCRRAVAGHVRRSGSS